MAPLSAQIACACGSNVLHRSAFEYVINAQGGLEHFYKASEKDRAHYIASHTTSTSQERVAHEAGKISSQCKILSTKEIVAQRCYSECAQPTLGVALLAKPKSTDICQVFQFSHDFGSNWELTGRNLGGRNAAC